jgi:phosphoglycolate phosphatase
LINHKEINIQTAIFDYDGTLVRLNINFNRMRQGVEEILISHCIEPEGLKGLYILEMIDEATTRIKKRSPYEGSIFYRKAMALVIEYEVRAARKGRILSGVPTMLKELRDRGIKVGIITRNCDKAVRIVFPDIDCFSDVYLPRDSVTQVKPHPEHLALALNKLEVKDPRQCLMVGDHILDIEGGKRMGMKTAGVLTGKMTRDGFLEAGADFIVNDAKEIPLIICPGWTL